MKEAMQIFTPVERQRTRQHLVEFAQNSSGILGTLIVGSGAEGFGEDLSDLDIVYVTDPERYSEMLSKVQEFVGKDLHPIFSTAYQHRKDINVISILLGNYLETDIGVWSKSSLFASSPHWRVIQARDEAARQSIETSLLENPTLKREHGPLISGDDPLWQFVYGEWIAGKRGKKEKFVRHQQALDTKLQEMQKERSDLPRLLSELYSSDKANILLPLIAG